MSNERKNPATFLKEQLFEGERALFGSKDLGLERCVFANGESPLKESRNIALDGCHFEWKYPLWYCENVTAKDCLWLEMARSGVWYSNKVRIAQSLIQAPKNFRRCNDVKLRDVTFSNAAETLWMCSGVTLNNVQATGDYFAMNSTDIDVDRLSLTGNYCFDGTSNVTVRNSKLLSKDAFWNTRNVTVYDSVIVGEYLGWNSQNLTFVNCTIESLQGLCYIGNLKMVNCKTVNTTLAFEKSQIEVSLDSGIDSVFNPESGSIECDSIHELILESDQIDCAKTTITCKSGLPEASKRAPWR